MRRKEQPDNKEYKRVLYYFETFSSEPGMAVLKDMRSIYYDRQSYVPGDPDQTAFREGQRSVVFEILSALKSSKHPEIFEVPDVEFEE